MRRVVTGEEIAQLRNPDPFAVPAWRSPIYRTPLWIVAIVHAARLLYRLVRFLFRHPVLVAAAVIGVLMWRVTGRLGLAFLAVSIAVMLALGRTGQCWDNALSESFFASIKGELLDLQAWPSKAAARRAIVEYIAWYNGTRLHSTLGYRSPAEFEEDSKIKKVA